MIVPFAFGILWLAAIYLALFGTAALFRPSAALDFLGRLAQTPHANLAEGLVRLAIGVSFVMAAPLLAFPFACRLLGAFLAITALLMLLLPAQHRLLATKSVAAVRPCVRLIGLASLGLAGALTAILWGGLESAELIPHIDLVKGQT